MSRIFILDDQMIMCVLLSRLLRDAGYEVRYGHTSDALFTAMLEWPPQLVILDIYLNGEDGRSVARRLRSMSSVPILMLTGSTDLQVRVQSFDIGADDLLVKPFAHDELIARIRALLRRAALPAQDMPVAPFTNLRLDSYRRTLSIAGVGELLLTEVESRLLESLMSQAGRPLSRETLCKSVLHRPWSPGERSLDLHVSNLRIKLREFAPKMLEIQSVRGVGYRLLVTSAK